MGNKKVPVSGTRKIFMYVYLDWNARQSLKAAKDEEDGSFFHCMNTLLACAFTLESYLNHLGAELLPFWENLEMNRPKEKLNILAYHIPYAVDFGKAPFQSFTPIFSFRNTIAHGKTTTHKWDDVQELSHRGILHHPKQLWEKMCSISETERLFIDMEAMVTELHKAAGKGEYPFVSPESSVAWTGDQ